ncbi:CLUMA_CG012402, isoform A [Clunio marinus]|uniref:CLUMA_CG012402, isoform A n=1 Tax=Clunio marinus TaxID=568069 RepID=A0A1J1IFA1_9DIPT|nr:CLUMA_CG012402, isoform A [Clunio marinus]
MVLKDDRDGRVHWRNSTAVLFKHSSLTNDFLLLLVSLKKPLKRNMLSNMETNVFTLTYRIFNSSLAQIYRNKLASLDLDYKTQLKASQSLKV